MSLNHLLVVTRRFWPLADDSASRLLHLTAAMVRTGIKVTIATPRWHFSWPTRAICREVEIVRIGPAPTTTRYAFQFGKQLGDWIAGQPESTFDAILCDNAMEDVRSILQRSDLKKLPVVVRFDPAESNLAATGRLDSATADACKRAALVAVTGGASQQSLIASGISPDRIVRVIDGAAQYITRQAQRREASLQALRNAYSEFAIPRDGRVVLACTPLMRSSGVDNLVQAVGTMVDADAGLRVWMIGDGPERDRLFDRCRQEGWHRQILMPGNFEDFEELFQCADALVLPAPFEGLGFFAPSAWASGLPTVLVQTTDLKQYFGPEVSYPWMFEHGNMPALRNAIQHALKTSPRDPVLAAIRDRAWKASSMEQSLMSYRQLFERLRGLTQART